MEEDLRGYLDWITQAEDLDADPAILAAGKDNGAGKARFYLETKIWLHRLHAKSANVRIRMDSLSWVINGW